MSRSPHRREHERPKQERPREARSRLDTADLKALRAVGTFRIVNKDDLKEGNIQRLINNRYIVRKTLHQPGKGTRYEILTSTKKGLDYLRDQAESDKQQYWKGIVKPREVAHDLAIYPAYEREKKAIEDAGGSVRRVVVDYEFKSKINPVMNRPGAKSQAERRKELAEEYDLPLVDGKLMLPDARIEYTDIDGHEQHKDIEVTTDSYRGSMMAAKSKSGFSMHRAGAAGGRSGTTVLDDHNEGYL